MKLLPVFRGALSSVVVALVVCLACLGCESLTLDREPDAVHLEITSPEVEEVTLVISQWFIQMPDPDCPGCDPIINLREADTTTVSLPFKQSYPFTFRLQFFAEAYISGQESATLSMRALVDDEEWYNDSRALQPAGETGRPETLRFVYQFSRLTLPT